MIIKLIVPFTITALAVFAGTRTLLYLSSRPLTKVQAIQRLYKIIKKASRPHKYFSGIQALIHSERLNIHVKEAFGTSAMRNPLHPDQPYHIASIGKLFTASIIYRLAHENKIDLDNAITTYLPKERLEGIFQIGDRDYSADVTIRQLLSHTSGAPDYISDPLKSGGILFDRLKTNPDHFYTPDELLDLSAMEQNPISPPNEGYHYSDTGYMLLGKLIEVIESEPVESVFERMILKPLEMNHTYMALRSKPLETSALPLADIWLDGSIVSNLNILSIDWTGGGIISTLDDLLKFSKALHTGKLVPSSSLNEFFSNQYVFEKGIYTGGGGMTVRLKEMAPFTNLGEVNGHIGILSTHLFYDQKTDAHIILNLGSDKRMVKSFITLINIMSVLNRIAS